MLWLVTASIGDAPIAIIACVALVLGVVLAARGRRGEPLARSDAAPEEPAAAPDEPAAAMLSVPMASAAAPVTTAATPEAPPPPPAPAVGHGPIRFVTRDDEPVELAAVEPEPAAAEPEPEPHADEPPPPPPPPATPQPPPTTFRQGSIKMGGLDRRR